MSVHLVSPTVLHAMTDEALRVDHDRIRGLLTGYGALTVAEDGTETVDDALDQAGVADIYRALTAEAARRLFADAG